MYLPSVPILPGALVLAVLSTYTRKLPLPEHETDNVPLVTVLVSPVTQSTYVPFSILEKVAPPEIVTNAYESVVASV